MGYETIKRFVCDEDDCYSVFIDEDQYQGIIEKHPATLRGWDITSFSGTYCPLHNPAEQALDPVYWSIICGSCGVDRSAHYRRWLSLWDCAAAGGWTVYTDNDATPPRGPIYLCRHCSQDTP